MKSAFVAALIAAIGYAYTDGVWSGHDWFDEDEGVGIKNGVPYGLNPQSTRRITSATLKSGSDNKDSDDDDADNDNTNE